MFELEPEVLKCSPIELGKLKKPKNLRFFACES